MTRGIKTITIPDGVDVTLVIDSITIPGSVFHCKVLVKIGKIWADRPFGLQSIAIYQLELLLSLDHKRLDDRQSLGASTAAA